MSGASAGLMADENGVDLARIVLVHGHRHVQPGLAPPDTAHHFETAHVRAHQERSMTRIQLRAHERFALDRDVEVLVLCVDEVDAIVDARGEIQQVPEAVAGVGLRPSASRK